MAEVLRGAKPWWESLTVWGTVAVLVGVVGRKLGYDLHTDGLANDLMIAAGAMAALYGRFRATKKIT